MSSYVYICLCFLCVLIGVPSRGDHLADFTSVLCPADGDHSVPCGRIVSVLQSSTTKDVYVALRNGIYEFDQDLRSKTFAFTSTSSGLEEENDMMAVTDGHIIICRKDAHGSCELRDLASLDPISGYRQNGVVDNRDGGGIPLSWIGKGPREQDVLHVALSTKGKSASTPILSTRYLPNNKSHPGPPEDFLQVLENEYFVPSAQWPNVRQLTVDIDPVYGFSDGNYDYLIKRQTDLLNGVAETKLIRLCRRDVNYRSYIELKLQCLSRSNTSMEVLYKNASSAILDGGALLVSFRSEGRSSLCRFNLSHLNGRFQERRRECLSGETPTAEIDWYQEIPCPSDLISQSLFNISSLDDPDFCYELDVAHPLGGNRPVLEDAFLDVDLNVTAIAVSQYQGDTFYYLGDETGTLFKMRRRSGIWETEKVEIDDGTPISPNGIIFSVDGDSVYVVTSSKVKKLPIDFNPSTAPPKDPGLTMEPQEADTMTFEPYIIYIICGVSALVVIIIVVILALSIKFGLRKYRMNVG